MRTFATILAAALLFVGTGPGRAAAPPVALVESTFDVDAEGWTSTEAEAPVRIDPGILHCEENGPGWYYVVAPQKFHGDWSGAAYFEASIRLDPSGSVGYTPRFQLTGGGTTVVHEFAWESLAAGEWRALRVPLRRTAWRAYADEWTTGGLVTAEQWTALVSSVTDLRIRLDLAHTPDGLESNELDDVRVVVATPPAADHVYVTDHWDGTVSVIDRTTMAQVETVAVGGYPAGIAATRDGSKVVVTNEFSQLDVIDTATRAREDSIPLGGDAWDVALSRDGTTAYLAMYGQRAVGVVDLVQHAKTHEIPLPSLGSNAPRPVALAITPDGSRVLVLDRDQSAVFAFDTAANDFVSEYVVHTSGGPLEIAISADGARALVVGNGAPLMFSVATGQTVGASLLAIGPQWDVTVAGDLAYAVNTGFNGENKAPAPRSAPVPGQPSVDVYRFSTATYVGSQALPTGYQPRGVAADETGTLFICRNDPLNAGTLLRYDAGTESETGHAATGRVPLRAAFVRTGETAVVSFFLPTLVNLTLAGAGKDAITTGGLFDDGDLPADFADPVTLEIGDFARTFTLVPNRTATRYAYRDAEISVWITPNLRGSSRGRFGVKVRKATLGGLVAPDGPVEIHFRATGLPDMAGTVVLEDGRYRRARKRGALLDPPFFAGLGQFQLKGDGQDSCTVRWGFSSGGTTPETLADVRVVIGACDVTIPGAAFVRSPRKGEESFRAVVTEDAGKLTITLDYKREIARVVMRDMELGDLEAGAATDFILDPGNGSGTFRNHVRLGGAGRRVFY